MYFLLFRGFSTLFCLFWLGKFPPSTKPAPHLFLLAAGTGQHRLFPAPCCTSPHPLQNRVPRVQVLLPLPKKSGIAAAVPDFFVSEQKDLAARCARRLSCGACRGALVACGDRPAPTEAAAETSPSLDFLLAFRVFSSGFTRSQLFPSSPAPKTHPVSPFSGFSGCVFAFFAVLWAQNFRTGFCASCRIAFTD